MTAILLVFELTQDYKLILPAMLVTILATLSAQLIQKESFTLTIIRRRGLTFGVQGEALLLRRIALRELELQKPAMLFPGDPASRILELARDQSSLDFPVGDGQGKYQGLIVGADVRRALLEQEALPLMVVAELTRNDLPVLTDDANFAIALDAFAAHPAESLPVVDRNGYFLGMLTRRHLMAAYANALGESA
jgi:CIC family chloride channel protein